MYVSNMEYQSELSNACLIKKMSVDRRGFHHYRDVRILCMRK
jgi:hypothetical protein